MRKLMQIVNDLIYIFRQNIFLDMITLHYCINVHTDMEMKNDLNGFCNFEK